MPPAARLRAAYLFLYVGVGSFLPFFAAYLRGLGFSGGEIGTLQMIPAVLAPAVALGWAAWSDRHGSPTDGLKRAAAVAAVAGLALPFARSPAAIGVVLALVALGDRAIVPLLDATTLEASRRGGPAYASIRLWGSIGFCLAALGVGRALAARGERPGDALVPAVMAAAIVAYALVLWSLPRTPAAAQGSRPGRADVRALLHDRALLAFFGVCFLHWTAVGPYHLFFGVLVRERGLPSDVTGLAMTAGVAAEILALLAAPRLERRFSPRALLAAAFAVSALRWFFTARVESGAGLVALQLGHGLTFGLFWATAMASLGVLVPPRLRATGQAILTAVLAASNAVAFQAAGRLYDLHGAAAPLFGWAAALELLALLAAVGLTGLEARRTAALGAAEPSASDP
jgi:MFS transporter, PPP family, 3-phenylpropionic acid transporter